MLPPDYEEVRFSICAQDLGFTDPDEIRARFRDVWRCYHGAGRYYHTWSHILSCFEELDRAEVEGLVQEPYVLEYAIYYHDTIYSVEFPEQNEELSARKACFRLPEKHQASVQRLILYTEPGMPRASFRDDQLMQDIDLAILGQDPDLYDAYAQAIRMEYAMYPREAFELGRKKVLEKLLGYDTLYVTDFFGCLYEEKARENLTRELDQIATRTV